MIRLFILFLLTAFYAHGQSDSVTISLQQANAIEKALDKCDLISIQLEEILAAEQEQRLKVMAQGIIISELRGQLKSEEEYSDGLEKDNRKLRSSRTLYKVLTGVALVGGFLL